MSVEEHRARAPEQVRFAILTVSDTRTKDDDESGQLIIELVEAAYHLPALRALCKDDPEKIRQRVREACEHDAVDCLVITGGTGISRRDSTHDTLAGLYELELPGFGELFRWLSHRQVGAAAMLSRASAGLVAGKPVFSLPGSAAAVRLGMQELILPEIGHVIAQAATRRESPQT